MIALGTLPIGTRFRCCSLTGELVGLSGGSATVKLDSDARKKIIEHDGPGGSDRIEFVGPARQTWSLGTEVEVIHS